MTSQTLSLGDWICFDGDDHQVVGFDGPAVRLRSASGRPQIILAGELLAAAGFRRLAVRPATSKEPALKVDSEALLDCLPDGERARVQKLEADLREVIYGYPEGQPETDRRPRQGYDPDIDDLTERIARKAAELGLSERQMWRVYEAYRDFGVSGIVDKRKVRLRNPLAGLDPRITEAILAQHAVEEQDSTGGNARFLNRVQRRLNTLHGEGVVVLPSNRTFRRKVAELLRGRHTFGPASTRQRTANQPKGMHGHFRATRPGEVVMLDTTRLDVLAYDPVTASTVSLELTIALDLTTRSILAWRITPVGTKAVDAVLLLADMMAPERMRPGWDDQLRYAYLGVHAERLMTVDQRLAAAAARPVIYPEILVVDNGKIFVGGAVKNACLRYGITLQFARLRKPTDKPEVERAFGTIRTQFSEHVAGYKGRDVANRGPDVEGTARWTIEEIEEFFAEYVVAVYQRRPHDGLRIPGAAGTPLSPNDAYAEGVHIAGYIPCPLDANQYMELLPVKWRAIQPYGIEIDGLIYDGPALGGFRRVKSPYPEGKGQWPVRVDPRNLLHVYFKNPNDGTWHVLEWTDAEDRLEPFTDRTLDYVKYQLASRGSTHPLGEEVAAALRDLQDRTDAPEAATAKDRRRLSRDRARAQAVARDQAGVEVADEPRRPLRAVATPDAPAADDDLGDISGFAVYGSDDPSDIADAS